MKKKGKARGLLLGLLCAALAAGVAWAMAARAGEQMRAQELALLTEQVRQAAISCYASEGRYPQELAYLMEHYGLVYDETRYSVWYDAFASNVIPDISVSLREDSGL